jgi:hypothetical protein
LYGDATGTFSARKIARATDASMPCHCLAGGLHPAHATMANVRTTWLQALTDLCVPILLSAQAMGVLTLGNLSLDGTHIPADASKSRARSYPRLRARASPRRPAVDTLFVRTAQAEQTERPAGLVSADAIALRHERLAHLAPAHAV